MGANFSSPSRFDRSNKTLYEKKISYTEGGVQQISLKLRGEVTKVDFEQAKK